MFEVSDFGAPLDLDAGEWVEGFARHPNTRLKVRGSSYPPFLAELSRLQRAHGSSQDPEFVAGASAAVVEHLLLDWENFVADGGEPLDYSKDLAMRYLTTEDDAGRSKAMRLLVLEAARRAQDRIDGIIEDVEGN